MNPVPANAKTLRGLGEPGRFLIVDPGKRCGIGLYTPAANGVDANTVPLDDLPHYLLALLGVPGSSGVTFVVCEDYSLLGGNRKNDPKMPSAQGIGMVKLACEMSDKLLYLAQPGCKRAGQTRRMAASREAARNDHERDVVDIAGYVIREMTL